MPNSILSSIGYGDYIAVYKFVIFLASFFLWMPLIAWVDKDAEAVGTRKVFWVSVIFGSVVVTTVTWLTLPFFVVGLILYLTVLAITTIAYVKHRNSIVMDYDKILTIEHIKKLFGSKDEETNISNSFLFITANKNEVPLPQNKTPDFYGYKVAYGLLADATWRRASDVILSSTSQNYEVTYYVDGTAIKQPAMDREKVKYLIHFIKNLADLDRNEKRKPQMGNFRIRQNGQDLQWDVVTTGSTAGEQIRLKQTIKHNVMGLSEIGLTGTQYSQLNEIRSAKQGLFIVAGPKKSGITTTFYALLKNHDPFLYSINTLEKRIAAELPNTTQNVFTLSDTGTSTYAKRLQQIVRTGPDVVGVGECSDAETARVACELAKDGRIIYVVIEADGVIKALTKWIDLVGDKNTAVEPLLGITNQRLLRKLCDECKQGYEPNRDVVKKFGLPADKARVLYRPGKPELGRGDKQIICDSCQGTGFVGRMAVFETIVIDNKLREGIRKLETMSEIAAQFRQAKMLYLQEQALMRVVEGTTAINEVVRMFATSKKQPEKPRQV